MLLRRAVLPLAGRRKVGVERPAETRGLEEVIVDGAVSLRAP
jgi:hypothetical protein